jgi:hypothetical protein
MMAASGIKLKPSRGTRMRDGYRTIEHIERALTRNLESRAPPARPPAAKRPRKRIQA